MKKNLFIYSFFITVMVSAQITDSTNVYFFGDYKKLKNGYTYKCHLSSLSFPEYKNYKFPSILFAGVDTCKAENYLNKDLENKISLKFAYGNDLYYMPIEDTIKTKAHITNLGLIGWDKVLDLYNQMDSVSQSNFSNRVIDISVLNKKVDRKIAIKEISDELKAKSKYGVIFLENHPYDDYGTTGMRFKIINPNKKTIKYIHFYVRGYNPVMDPVRANDGDYVRKLKGIGPIQELSTASWEFDSVWLTDIVDSAEVIKVHIIYMDGTSQTINFNNEMYFSKRTQYNWEIFMNE